MSIETNAPQTASAPTVSASGLTADDTATDLTAATVATASADFVRAVSDFLDTDPTDLLRELGYYDRDKNR